uniref:Fucosyltransferase n=1 Tax=Ciona savignyi TaxID=51511 RepID=H2Y9S2_CIOSA
MPRIRPSRLCIRYCNNILVGIILMCVCYGVLYYEDRNGTEMEYIISARIEGGKILILSWRRPWGNSWKGHGEGQEVGNCILTYDRTRISEAAAVIFHYTALDDEAMPWKHYRNKRQFFIFWTVDGPSYIRNAEDRHPKKFDNFINWTMTYRLNSDIFYPHLSMDMAKIIFSRRKEYVDDILSKKSRLGIWVAHDCDILRGSKLRMKYIDKLIAAGLSIDRYGWCFGNKESYKKLSQEVLHSYKFYFAFEDAEKCNDYVTSEFWEQSVYKGKVPVVWGTSKATVEDLVPPGSFIHTDDFESPAQLAKYLRYLDKNDEAYREYFNWNENPDERTLEISKLYEQTGEVELCEKLQSKLLPKVTNDISLFHYGVDWGTCIDYE